MQPSEIIISKRYAKAFNLLNDDLVSLKKSFNMLQKVALGLESVKDFLSNPTIAKETKLSIMKDVLKDINENVSSFILVLIETSRYYLLGSIVEEIENIIYEHENTIRVDIETAFKVSDEEKKDIEEHLESILEKKLESSFSVDPSLLMGIKAKADDILIDASLSNNLEKLKQDLKEE